MTSTTSPQPRRLDKNYAMSLFALLRSRPHRSNYDETLADRRANTHNDWCAHGGGEPKPTTAQARFHAGGFFDVNFTPRFDFGRHEKIYTIGSCFARNVERFLVSEGMTVPTAEIDIDPSVYSKNTRFKNTILNKYNPASMASEMMRGLGLERRNNRGLIHLGNGKYFDPQASLVGAVDRETADKIRDALEAVSAQIKNCSVFVLTLGLTETWWDDETGMVLNGMNGAILRPIRHRLRFGNVGVEEAFGNLRDALASLKREVPGAKVIVTVSPVPLANTFTAMDVVTANTISKATLRIVAQRLYETFDFVDYFPSYEMVMNSERSVTWWPDTVHPTDEIVGKVIGRFMESYVRG